MPAPETAETHSSELPRSELWLFGVTIFLGAFLLFQVQPVIGKYILPWFGGTPGVWTTCLLFFQCLLLGGYAYAHWLSQLAPRRQAQIHLTLLGIVGVILGGVFLSMIGGLSPIEWLKPDPATAADRPVLGILTLLLVGIGLPYLVLSSTGPLIQAWFARKYEGRSPYRLYALSNVGSLLALITYPFLVEPYTTRGLQVGAWAFGMVGFAVICGWLARSIRRIPEADTESESKSQVKAPDLKRQLLWLLLPACGTAQLMATTNKVSQDVAVTPFLWILPLTLYLLSFIIAFDSPRWYSRLVYTLLLVGCWGGTLWILKKGVDSDILAQVGILNLTLFLGCMVCHGELYKLRPEPALLTRYFLTISAGGALGGLFVALVAPTIFDGYWEYQLAVWGCGALLAGVCFVDKTRWALNSWWVRLLLLASWLAVCWAVYQRGNVFVPHVWLLCLRLMFVSCFVTYLLGLLFKAPSSRPKLRLLGLAALGALCSLGDSAMTLELSGYRNLLTNPLVAFAALLLLSSISFVWSSVRGWEGWRLPAYMPLAVLVAGLGGLLLAQIRKDRENIDIQSRNFYGVIRIYDNDLTSYNVSGHKTTVTGVVISPDGLKLASTSADGDTRVWNCETIEEIWPLYTDGPAVRAMTFSPDNQWLVTGDATGHIRFWDFASGREKKTFDALKYPPTSLAFSPDGQWLAAGCEGGKVRLWSADSGKYTEQSAVDAHSPGAVILAFLDNTRYVTGGHDGKVRINKIAGGDPERTLSAVGPVQALAVSRKSGRLATAGERGVVQIWDIVSGKLQHDLVTGQGGINSLAFNSAGTRLAAAGKDGGVSTWQYSSAPAFVGRVNEREDGWYRIFTLEGHKGGASAVAFLGAKSWLPKDNEYKKLEWIISGGADSFVRVWNTDNHSRRLINGRITHGIQYSNPEWAEMRTSYYSSKSGIGLALDLRRDSLGAVRSVAFSPDGRRVVTGSEDNIAKIWDAADGTELMTLNGHGGIVASVAFSPDSLRLVTGSEDNTAKIWDAESGTELMTLKGHDGIVTFVAFSPDGRRVVTGGVDNTAKIWDVENGRTSLTLKGHRDGVCSVAFSPDGRRVVTGSFDKTAKIWDAANGTELLTLKESDTLGIQMGVSVAFSPDGRHVVTGSRDQTAKIWDSTKGTELLTLKGQGSGVASVAFSPDGRHVVTGSGDNTAQIWDAENGTGLLTLKGHEDDVISVAFSSDGRRVVTGSGDQTAKIWDAGDGTELLTLKGRKQKVGVVGLGTGSVAVYAKDGDEYLFYDINPEVERVAEEEYSHLRDARRRGAQVKVVLGDARLSMEQEEPHGFDVLVLDAFSSDAIPVHLLTREALQIYERHMDEGGVIAVHISNRHLQLEGVVLRLAKELKWDNVRIYGGKEDADGEEKHYLYYSEWILLTRNQDFLQLKEIMDNQQTARSTKPQTLWTDDHVSILPIVESPAWWQRIKGWPSRMSRWWRQTQ